MTDWQAEASGTAQSQLVPVAADVLDQLGALRSIGVYGERLVFELLQKDAAYTQTVWLNAQEEAGLPYDIITVHQGQQQFIEVKTSTDARKQLFELSVPEVREATNRGAGYWLYFVTGAGTPDVAVRRLRPDFHLPQQRAAALFVHPLGALT